MTERTLSQICILTAPLAILILGCTDRASMNEKAINDIDLKEVVTLQARLLANGDLNQSDSEPVDVSKWKELLLALLTPAKRTATSTATYIAVCDLEFRFRDDKTVRVRVYWPGNASVLYFSVNDDKRIYQRIGKFHAIAKDMYVDEPAMLCRLVKAVVQSDHNLELEAESFLSRSVGFDSANKP